MNKPLMQSQRTISRTRVGGWVSALSALLALSVPGMSLAQATGTAVVSVPNLTIKGFDVTGENPLAEGETTRLLARFLRANATPEALKAAAAALEQGLMDKGFLQHRVGLPSRAFNAANESNVLTLVVSRVADTSNPTFVIKSFDVKGDNPLGGEETARLLAPFQRPDATIETLQQATAALEAGLKQKGFALHRVALPAQEVNPVIKLNVVKFVIGKVTVEGRKNVSEANVRASVPELAEGQAPNFRTLAVQTAIANENPGKRVQVALKESDEPDKIDARVVLQEGSPWQLSASLGNTGATSTGNDRLSLTAGHSNLFDRDHQLSAAYTTSLERPSAVQQLGLSYRAPLYRQGGVLGMSYTQSDVAGDFGVFKSTGAGRTFGVNYSLYLPPQGGHRGYVTLGFDDKQFDVTLINSVPLPGQLVRRSQPITLGYNARVESDKAVWGYSADIALNVPGGSGNDLAAYRTEDPRISTAQWRAVRGAANYATGVAAGWTLSLRGQVQFSPDALIAGEQFGLGGSTSVRGVGERPLSGDSGVLFSTEMLTPELIAGLRVLGFVDAGWLANNSANGRTKPASDSLSSLGLGLRYTVANYSLTADFGRVLGGTTLPPQVNSGLPQSGDQKLHVNLTARF